MPLYSHSRLSAFEKCPRKFKFRYLDRIIPPLEKTIETHLGKSVHTALEWLYLEVKEKRIPSIDDVVIYYSKTWEKNWDPAIKNVKKQLTTKDFFNRGVQFLLDYYMRNKPFDDNTLDIEKRIFIILDQTGKYKIQGFIDRLVYNLKTKEYEIHDYKTSSNLPQPENVDNDRQLGLYSLLATEDSFQRWRWEVSSQTVCLWAHVGPQSGHICAGVSGRHGVEISDLSLCKGRCSRRIL